MSKFSGASAISSADFYEEGEGNGRAGARSFDLENMNASELMGRLSLQVTHQSSPWPSVANSIAK